MHQSLNVQAKIKTLPPPKPRRPIIQAASKLAAIITPSIMTALFCEIVHELVALANNSNALPSPQSVTLSESMPPEISNVCRVFDAGLNSSTSSFSGRTPPLPDKIVAAIDAANPKTEGLTGHASWLTRLETCVARFHEARLVSYQDARYIAPLLLIDCLNTVPPIMVGNNVTFSGMADITRIFNVAAARVFTGDFNNNTETTNKSSSNSSSSSTVGTSKVRQLLGLVSTLRDALGKQWAVNGDHIDYFTKAIALKRLLNTKQVDDAVAGVCLPFCPAKRSLLPSENNYNGWLDGWESRGNIKEDSSTADEGDRLGTVRGLQSIFGRLQYFYSPNNAKTRRIMDAALAPYNDLALLLRGMASTLSLSSVEAYTPGQQNVSFEEVWWCSADDVQELMSPPQSSSNPTLLSPLEQFADRHAANWTIARTDSIVFKANNFRKNSMRRITADFVVPPSRVPGSSPNATAPAPTTRQIAFQASGECADWANCAAPGGLCECNTTIRYLFNSKREDENSDGDGVGFGYSDRRGDHGGLKPSRVLCTHDQLNAHPPPSSAPSAIADQDILLCQCAAELACKGTLRFGTATGAGEDAPPDPHVTHLDTVLNWDSSAEHRDGGGSRDEGKTASFFSNTASSPSTSTTSDFIQIVIGKRYRLVLTYFNAAQGDAFELTARDIEGNALPLLPMLQFPNVAVEAGVCGNHAGDNIETNRNQSTNGCSWMLPSIAPLSTQFPSLTPALKGFESKDEMLKAVSQNWVDARGVHFDFDVDNATADQENTRGQNYSNLNYTVHYSPDIEVPTSHIKGALRPIYKIWGVLTWDNYVKSGISTMIQNIDRAILALAKNDTMPSNHLVKQLPLHLPEPLLFQSLPTPAYHSGHFLYNCRLFLPLVLVLAFIYPVSVLVKSVVSERELRLNETMKMWGLSNEVNWLGWFLVSFCFAEVTVIILVMLLKFGKIFEYSSFWILFLFFSLVALATTSLSFLFSVMFSKAKVAAASSGLIYFLLYLPATLINARRESVSRAAKRAASLMAPTSFGLGCTAIADWELMMVGVTSANYNQPLSAVDLSLADICIMLLVDAIIYMVIAWYIDNVWPGEFGQGVPFLFFLPDQAIKLLTGQHQGGKDGGDGDGNDDNDDVPMLDTSPDTSDGVDVAMMDICGTIEGDASLKDPVDGRTRGQPAVAIKQLSKVYGDPRVSKMVLKNINLNLAQGQLTTLLGSNGAGKSTLLNIITGLYPATAGSIVIDGMDMANPTHVHAIRRRMGVCPQANVLFQYLTVGEHVDLVHALRVGGDNGGRGSGSATDYTLLREVGLEEKKETLACNLSGGQKRKLCLLLAFVANPAIVVLDEPTAGVDPESRRQVWDMILKHRREQTVLLCTHHMDEADVLSDQLAFISEGTILCTGTVEELKRKYGEGSIMSVQFTPPPIQQQQCADDVVAAAEKRKRELLLLIQRVVPNAEAIVMANTEFKVKLADASSSEMSSLLELVDKNSRLFGIATLGLSAPKLKDVFIALTDIDPATSGKRAHSKAASSSSSSPPPSAAAAERADNIHGSSSFQSDAAAGWGLTTMQLKGLLHRRLRCSMRDFRALFAQFILPVIFVLIAMLIATSLPPVGPEPELVLQPKRVYREPIEIPMQDACTSREIDVAVDGKGSNRFSTFVSNVESASFAGTTIKPRPECTNFTQYLYSTNHNGNGDVAFRRIPRIVPTATVPSNSSSSSSSKHITNADPDIGFSRLLTADDTVRQPLHATVAMFESRNYHGLPLVLSRAGRGRCRPYNVSVTASLGPIAHRLDLSAMEYLKSGIDIVVTVFILLALSFIPASVVLQVVQNKGTGLTHLQFTSGLPPAVFWFANFLFDFATYSASTVLVVLVISVFDIPAFSGAENKVACAILFLAYGWATIPLMYWLSSKFSEPTSAYIGTLMATLMTGITTTLSYFVLATFVGDVTAGSLVTAKSVSKVIFLIFPSFGLGRGLLDITQKEYEARSNDAVAELLQQPPPARTAVLSWGAIGQIVFVLIVEGIVFFSCRVKQDVAANAGGGCKAIPHSKDDRPSDGGNFELLENGIGSAAAAAAAAVTADDNAGGVDASVDTPAAYVRVNAVTHRYGSQTRAAVDDVSFSAGRGRVFGLLGVNGAGKTTLFKIMTGAIAPTAGSVQVNGFDTGLERSEARAQFGYCPQSVECLFPNLTGEEHLAFFAALRGISAHRVDKLTTMLFGSLGLEQWRGKRACTYSGGNKRKLSVAIALLAQPPVLFLDEPTAGVDPLARRNLWNQIRLLSGAGCCVIVTSHSIEECESLCESLCIMVDGNIAAMGTPQQLQTEHGDGYNLVIDLEEVVHISAAKYFVDAHFDKSNLIDEYKTRLRFSIGCKSVGDVCHAFATLDGSRKQLHIVNFTLSQPTLESAFCTVVGETSKEGEESVL